MMMSHKRRGQDDRKKQLGGGKRSRSRWSKQHLYLVVDDWDKGFSIHKIDADSFADDDSGSGDDEQHQYHQLAETPPVLRVESAAGNEQPLYMAASGTKMFIIMKNRCGLVYDADTGVLAVGTHAPPRMVFGFGECMPVGEVLYLLSYRLSDSDHDRPPQSFEAMSWSPAVSATGGGGGGGWAWKTLPAPPPTFTRRQMVVAHAVHPDGCTIFMTTAYRGARRAPVGTYSFNTREATWRWHGAFALPFQGQAHFDAELGAWVGLHFHFDGHLCSCQVISTDFVSARPPRKEDTYVPVDPKVYLDHQITKEKLVGNQRSTSSLTSLGSTGRFCLVECVPSATENDNNDNDHGRVLHVSIFGVKYNHKGELLTTNHRSARSFVVPRPRLNFHSFAFWA